MKKTRDEFSKSVINTLKSRSSSRCSNPDCRISTVGPAGEDAINNIGKAAHITAAAPGGPRYDPDISSQERKSLSNGIWLCANCADKIDRDVITHTVEVLQEWKRIAVYKADKEFGKKPPSETDAIDTLTMALTGQPKNIISSAIQNVHSGVARSIEQLDPRFEINTAYSNGITHFRLYAKEQIDLNILVKQEKSLEFTEKHRALVDNGIDLQINTDSIAIEGSKLLDYFLSQGSGNFYLSTEKHEAAHKFILYSIDSDSIIDIIDIPGHISIGTKSFTFEGYAFKNLMKLKYTVPINIEERSKFDIDLTFNFSLWEGVELRCLPYIEKLYQFFNYIYQDHPIGACLEMDGAEVLSGKNAKLNNNLFFTDWYPFIEYTMSCMEIARKLNVPVQFNSKYLISEDQVKAVLRAASIIKGKCIYFKEDIKGKIGSQLVITNENCDLKFLENGETPVNIEIHTSDCESLNIFGSKVKVPCEKIVLEKITPVFNFALSEIKLGDLVDIEWVPQDEFRVSYEYQS